MLMRRFGYARLGNKRSGAPGKPGPGEIAIDVDRRNPVLGNPFVLHEHRDAVARAAVIERYRAKYDADVADGGPMSEATAALAERVRNGERLVLMCWRQPKPCHGSLIIAEINRRLGITCEEVAKPDGPHRKGTLS
jgi:Domain of unknown function (DUF4326)